MAPNIPYAVSGQSETAENFRRALGTVLGVSGGIGQPNSSWTTPLKVTANGTNVTLTVAPGEIWVPNSLSSPKGGLYYCLNDANYSINLSTPPSNLSGDTGVPWTGWTAPSAGNSQIIDICAVVYDTDYSFTYTGMHTAPWAEFWLMPVFGTAAATPSPPTVPSNALVLCQFTVTSSTSAITNAMLTDFRFPVGLANIPGAVPIAGSVEFHGGTVPPGWVLEDGSTYQVSKYPALAATFGSTGNHDGLWDAQYFTNHGSNVPAGFFAVPDSRSRVFINAGSGPGLTSRAFGALPGTETAALSSGNMPPHNHPDTGHTHPITDVVHGHGVTDNKHGHTGAVGTGASDGWIVARNGGQNNATVPGATGDKVNPFIPAAISVTAAATNIGIQGNFSGISGSGAASATSTSVGSGTAFSIMQPALVATKILRAY